MWDFLCTESAHWMVTASQLSWGSGSVVADTVELDVRCLAFKESLKTAVSLDPTYGELPSTDTALIMDCAADMLDAFVSELQASLRRKEDALETVVETPPTFTITVPSISEITPEKKTWGKKRPRAEGPTIQVDWIEEEDTAYSRPPRNKKRRRGKRGGRKHRRSPAYMTSSLKPRLASVLVIPQTSAL